MAIYSSSVTTVGSIPANVTGSSGPVLNVNQLESYTIFAVFSGLGGGAAGNVSIEVSPDGVSWTIYQGSTLSYTSSTTMHSWEFQIPSHVMSRVLNQVTTPGGGTINILVSRKGTNN